MGRTTYADNALNRKMGRVGQPYRFAVTYRQQTTRRRGRRSKRGKRRKRNPKRSVKRGKRVYVDNAQNRRLNRVGKSYARSGGRTAKAPKSRRLNEREWGARQRRQGARQGQMSEPEIDSDLEFDMEHTEHPTAAELSHYSRYLHRKNREFTKFFAQSK